MIMRTNVEQMLAKKCRTNVLLPYPATGGNHVLLHAGFPGNILAVTRLILILNPSNAPNFKLPMIPLLRIYEYDGAFPK